MALPIRLPELTVDIDAKDLHPEYEGIKITLAVNPAYGEEYVEPWSELKTAGARALAREKEPWLASSYFYRSQRIRAVRFPKQFTEDGKPYTVRITDARSLWDLESDTAFDPIITMWAHSVWLSQRDDLLSRSSKN
jgi:hypothetical protein